MKLIINKTPTDAGVIEVSGVDFSHTDTTVFRALTLSIAPGAVTAVTGPNGCRKSTLLELLAGVHPVAAGTIARGTRNVALAVQRSAVTDSFPVTVTEAVMMGRWRHLGLLRRPGTKDRATVEYWLTELGLTDLRHRTMGELSGGQRQRVLLAQAFAQDAPLLLLDEPTTGLDADSARLVLAHLRRFADAGTTVVAATHDCALIAAAEHRVELG